MISLDPRLTGAVEAHLGAAVTGVRRVGGGSIHSAALLELADGSHRFLKWSAGTPADMFPREAEGLGALAAAGAIRVPGEPRAGELGDDRSTHFLLMEAIPTGPEPAGFSEAFGRAFAELHRTTAGDSPAAGFPHDNYIGTTPQPNGWMEAWPAFFRQRRLGFQLGLARSRGLATPELARLGDRLLERLDDLLDTPGEPPCLLHGDLWGGNYLCDARGRPVLIDPATYYGHREADLAMTHLFGGFDPAFHHAYQEAWPLPPGTTERQEIYKLYHLLNHLNLFGGGYLTRCLAILRRFA